MKSQTTVEDVPIWSTPAYIEPDGRDTLPDGTPYHPEGLRLYLRCRRRTRAFYLRRSDDLPGQRTLEVPYCVAIGPRTTMDRTRSYRGRDHRPDL